MGGTNSTPEQQPQFSNNNGGVYDSSVPFDPNFDFKNIPGIFSSEQIEEKILAQIRRWENKDGNPPEAWIGSLSSLITQTMPDRFKQAFENRDPENAPPAPEVKPYTFWERVGAMPVNVTRLRPRQFYYPITDFRDYTYDESSPEETQLKAEWMSRMFDVSWQWPGIFFCCGFACVLPLPPIYRGPGMVVTALTAVFLEGARVYVNAGEEREKLDDYIVAKEIWYIKNVEALELGLLPRNKEAEERRELKKMQIAAGEAKEARDTAMYASSPLQEPLNYNPDNTDAAMAALQGTAPSMNMQAAIDMKSDLGAGAGGMGAGAGGGMGRMF